ncbi:MAG: Holliday junction resolvase RuvX [Desulfitobacteriaceae bacterium]|nr:Holliday junction resolvase RuvX [Desulfitobacteriaceae bacterium]MDD4751818.1 Holliday junction resolvase RuvX [Desulfitobacteriaceae bacterium]
MRLMGLDVGERTIGVAVSDPFGWTAQGIMTIRRFETIENDVKQLKDLVTKYQVTQIVVGLPKNMNGTLGPSAEKCQNMADILRESTGLPVVLWDERLSTMAAERTLLEGNISRKKRKQVIDKMAAVIILQGYLDFRQKNKND